MIDWTSAAEAVLPDMTALRRAIHAEPELGLSNPRTAEKIMAALAGLPLDIRTGPSTSGIIATLKGPANGRTVLLRGDTDALPMPEETGLDFSSTIPGAMHACGHDAHVAMLAGAARILCERRDSLAGSVMFMFQPGEEGHHGARYMLDDGLIDPLPDAAFALHIMPNAPWGVVAGRTGALLASNDKLRIVITGRGGHASMPHDALDPGTPAMLRSVLPARMRLSGSPVTTVKFHGWVFIDDGERIAMVRISLISSSGTGSGLKPRMERRPITTSS